MYRNLFSRIKCHNVRVFILTVMLGLSFSFSASAAICFLPSGNCETIGSTATTECDPADYVGRGYTEFSTMPDAAGWICQSCSSSFVCTKRSCPTQEGYESGKTCDDATEITSCSGYSGDDECCKCENRAQKCLNEGYVYVKNSDKNVCVDVCPYDNNYYRACYCPEYNLNAAQATDTCIIYDECIITYYSTNTSYYKENGSNRTGCSANSNLVPETNDMVSDTEHYDCSPSCTEACENNNQGMRYYFCSRKPDCPGGYRSESECLEALATMYGQANAFDWRSALYEVAQCLLPVKPAYAQQVNTQPSITPEINGGNGYQQQTDTGETPELAGDDGYQQHMSQEEICKEKCKSQKATNFNKCVQACLGLALDENLDDFERVVGDWEFECVDCDNEPEPTTNEPTSTDQYECVQEGACWYHRLKTQSESEPEPESEEKYLYVALYSNNRYDVEMISGFAEQIPCRENECFNVTDSISNQGATYYSTRRYKVKKDAEVKIKSTACGNYVPEGWMGTLPTINGNGTDTITITFSENITSGLGDNYWGTIDTEPEEWVTIEPDYAEYDSNYFPTLGGCIDVEGACLYNNSAQCYVKNNTPARIYCSYDDMLKTGSGCWEGTSWFEHPCEGELHSPCEVDYQVTANNGSQGVTVCPGAQSAKNKPNNSSGPVEIPAGTYTLNVSYNGAIGYTSEQSQSGIPGVFIGSGNFKYWVPDVMLVMDNVSVNSFKCYNITLSGANKNSCSIPSKVKVQDELINSGLYNWAFYDQGMDSLKDCNAYESDKTYNFEAGKTYYIYVGSSGSHQGNDTNCAGAWGCGYRDN